MLHAERLPIGTDLVVDVGGAVPAVAVYLWFEVGTAAEDPAISGAAHLLEHMLFKGTSDHGVGDIAARIEGAGGEINALTSYEETVLHATMPLGGEGLAIELLARMALDPRLDARELRREKGVVLEEIRESLDDPGQRLAQEQRERVWGAHPYARPVLGTEASVRRISAEQLRAFHRRHYRPDDLVVAVAGPVDVPEVRRQVEAALAPFGGPPASRRPDRPEVRRPERPGPFAFDAGFEERTVELVFPIPGHAHPDIAALDLLAAALGDGSSAFLSARLHHELDLALATWAMVESEPDGGVLAVGLAAREDRGETATTELMRLLARVRREGVPLAALRRARASILADRLAGRETVDGRAYRRAWYQAFTKDPEGERTYEAALHRVSLADLQRVAETWLRPEHLVAGAAAPADELDLERFSRALAAGEEPVARVATNGRPWSARVDVVRRRLPSGVTVVVESDPDAELVGITAVGVGGALVEGPAGLSGAWATLVARGAADLDALDYAVAVEERAGSVGAWAGRNSNGVSGSFPAAELRAGLELVTAMLRAPRFDESEVTRVRTDMLEAQRSALDDPRSLAWDLAWQALYGAHPWGRPSLGTAASVARITRGRLRGYHRRVVQGANLVVGLAGAVDPDEAVTLLARQLGGLAPGAPVPVAPPLLAERFLRRRRRVVPRPGAPAALIIGFPSTGHGDPDDPAVALLAAVLGGAAGGTGRLWTALREERGLAYDVAVSPERGLGGGAFFCAVGTEARRVAEARRTLWEVLDAVARGDVDEAELERVKAGVVDGAVIGLQRALSRADNLAAAERFGDTAERYRAVLEAPRAVSLDQLRAVARRLLRRDRAVDVVVGPSARRG